MSRRRLGRFYDHDLIHRNEERNYFTSQALKRSTWFLFNPTVQYRHEKKTGTQGMHTTKITKIILTTKDFEHFISLLADNTNVSRINE